MSILEERFMSTLPSQLRAVADAVRELRFTQNMPIIEFTTEDGDIRTERFENALKRENGGGYTYRINEYPVNESEYSRIIKLVHSHPLFAN